MRVSLGFGATLLAVVSSNGLAQTPLPSPKGVPVPSTTITSVAPASLSLIAGSPAQKVVLNGTLLDRITAADIERNGVAVPYIAVTVQPVTSTTQRDVYIAAVNGAKPGTGPADLVVSGRLSGGLLTVSLKVPVQLDVTGQVLVHRDQLFGSSLAAVFQGAASTFTSCGVPADHVFSVALPNAPYSVNGTVARLEQQTTLPERAEFLRTHSINPTSVFSPANFASFGTTGHPSPFPHSVSDVRLCLETVNDGSWTFTSATQTGGAAQLNISIKFTNAVFRARGMPADPAGVISALNFGVGWGDAITDKELPDYTYMIPEYKLLLPITLSNGKVSYGTVQYSLGQQAVGWSGPYLGLSSLRTQMEQFAAARMTQIAQEIKKALESGNVRTAITNRIANVLQTSYGITSVVGLTLTTGDMWAVQYK